MMLYVHHIMYVVGCMYIACTLAAEEKGADTHNIHNIMHHATLTANNNY